MKVVYEKTVRQKLDDEILKAKESGKVIDKFILTENEWDAFLYEIKEQYLYYTSYAHLRSVLYNTIDYLPHLLYKGILVFKENKDNSNAK